MLEFVEFDDAVVVRKKSVGREKSGLPVLHGFWGTAKVQKYPPYRFVFWCHLVVQPGELSFPLDVASQTGNHIGELILLLAHMCGDLQS